MEIFFGKEPIENFENIFLEKKYDHQLVLDILSSVEINLYFGDLDKTELADLIYGADEDANPTKII